MREKIRNYIKKNGISQTHVAKQINMDIKSFNAMMTGRRELKAEEFRRICNVLNVNPAEFF